ncbi:hypothetical protein QJQ45_000450 [Haematococcus lacustris]|nr:hypothetical protein QJQ45_000450 [Haematococcus lacustris]
MTEYHTIYRGLPGDTTQWGDIQRKLGNLPQRAPVWKPAKWTPEADEPQGAALIDSKDAGELSDLDDQFSDDRFLEEYRQRRVQELRTAACRPRFGSVELIRASEFVQKVTQASAGGCSNRSACAAMHTDSSSWVVPSASTGAARSAQVQGCSTDELRGSTQMASAHVAHGSSAQPQGPLWVVVQLFKDGHGPSALMSSCIDELAARYPNTKFVRIISTECIPKYPDAHLPTLLVYHAGECVKHLVGLAMHGGNRATPERLYTPNKEQLLAAAKASIQAGKSTAEAPWKRLNVTNDMMDETFKVALVLNQLGSVCSSSADGEEGEEEGCGTVVRIRGPGDRAEDAHLMRQLVKRVVAAQEEGSDEDSDFD